jgi:FKBP-type peptidyl-prolyl cis-trans isomerase FklB
MQKLLVPSLVLSLLLAGAAGAQQTLPKSPSGAPAAAAPQKPSPSDQSPQQLLGYALGFNIGGNLRTTGAQVDLMSLQAGISDGLRGTPPKFSEAELTAALQTFQQQMQTRAVAEMARLGEVNKRKGEAFLAQNRKQPGVRETPSGLQYKVLRQGDGPSPKLDDTVRFHYRGTLIDGTEFQSSYGGAPVELPVRRLIPGWTEALQKMHVGDKWQLFVPADLAYGTESPDPAIGPNSVLVFDIELLGIDKP